MKKIILSLLLTLVLAGFLYATHTEPDEPEMVRASHLHMDSFSNPMPEVIVDPMVGAPMF